jgi:hypothetical protein
VVLLCQHRNGLKGDDDAWFKILEEGEGEGKVLRAPPAPKQEATPLAHAAVLDGAGWHLHLGVQVES